jgi:hypothetical protein
MGNPYCRCRLGDERVQIGGTRVSLAWALSITWCGRDLTRNGRRGKPLYGERLRYEVPTMLRHCHAKAPPTRSRRAAP